MPLFSNISGGNIYGGNFHDVAGNMNIENNQQFAIQDCALRLQGSVASGSQDALEELSTSQRGVRLEDAHRGLSLSGVTRPSRTGRPVPYDASLQHPTASERHSPPLDGSSSDHFDNCADDYNTTARLSRLSNLNAPGGDIGSNNGVFMSHPAPWSEDTHNPEPGTNIHGGMFIGGNVNNVHHSGETGIHILHRAVALEAMHDSADTYPQPRCHPETREEMLHNLWDWATKSVWEPRRQTWEFPKTIDALPVLWLYGPAGAGKSAIMRTLSERLADAGFLGGSFFFKRGHITRGNAQKLFSTLSYQLAHNIPHLRGPISKIVEDMPYLVAKSMNVQLQKLIMDPCASLDASRPTTIIIDGLDECEGRLVQQEVLRLISTAVCERPLSLRFLIASRPEPHIREIFEASLFGGLHHTCNVEQSKEDVRKYLLDAFARIHREHKQTMAGVLSPWPSQEVVDHFVKKSSGYFIYAWTVIRFIDDKDFRPTEQLEALQDASHLGSPFSALDQLYVQILSTVPACHRLLPILRALEFFDFQLHISGIEQVLELKPGDVRLILRNLHSILHVPKPGDKPFIHTYHASFLDFLNDQSRSGQFY
ncbi:hypothetical protein C8J57DRAFT_1679020, partial [Mycena rebaudengoi]